MNRIYTIKKEDKPTFKALMKCCGKDQSRPFLTRIHWNGERLSATDGRRLMMVDSQDLVDWFGKEEGYFNFVDNVLIEEQHDWKYPDINRLIIDDKYLETFKIPGYERNKAKFQDVELHTAITVWAHNFFNAEITENLGESVVEWEKIGRVPGDYSAVTIKGPSSGMHFNVHVVLMPMMDKDNMYFYQTRQEKRA